jgi:hypothetical protein
MHWTKTVVAGPVDHITANYDYKAGENHRDGVEWEEDGFQFKRRIHTTGWRGTGTDAAFTTGVVDESMTTERGEMHTGMVFLNVEIGNTHMRIAMYPAEAKLLAEKLVFKANEAAKVNTR